MRVKLEDLSGCFEGVIPSIVATAAADGTPNVSYLSHVVMVDTNHVALSNQFFAKTAANIRANPRAAVLLIDGVTGQQYELDLRWESSIDRGELFDRIARDLRVSSAQVGMADVMRLKAVDVFQVVHTSACPGPAEPGPGKPAAATPTITQLASALRSITSQTTTEDILDALLNGAATIVGCEHAMVLLPEFHRDVLVAVASLGYDNPGTGSEVLLGDGLIGESAAGRETLKINDLSRVKRFGSAVVGIEPEDRTRSIPFPHTEALSQIALPMIAQQRLVGVLFLESRQRLAFTRETEAALEALAVHSASALSLAENSPVEKQDARPKQNFVPAGRPIQVVSHSFDDSVFIEGRYVIKGVAGRLLLFLLENTLSEGRSEFTNREIRRAAELRLPDYKDNLETRLLLLRRRLEEKDFPIRLERVGRGRIKLTMLGHPQIDRRL